MALQCPDLRESLTLPVTKALMHPTPSLADVDTVDAHHSTTCLHHPIASPKNDALKRDSDTALPPSDLGVWSLGFLPQQPEWVDEDYIADAFNKGMGHGHHPHLP
jgi:hypothetical protein